MTPTRPAPTPGALAPAGTGARRGRGIRGVARSRSWAAPVAWGAGLVAIALGAGAIVSPTSIPAAVVGGALVVAGAAALAWGAGCLLLARTLAPRAAIAGSLAGIALLCALLLLAPARTSVLAVAAGVVLLVVTALVGAAASRGVREHWSEIGGLLVGAVLVAALVTPALAGAQDATLRQDDGTIPVIPSHH